MPHANKLGTLTEISIINDMTIIQHPGKNSHGFLIRDQEFADTFKEMFGKIWKQAREYYQYPKKAIFIYNFTWITL